MDKLNIIAETKVLVQALSFANSVVEKRNIIAALENVKLAAKGNMLEIIAANSDIYLSQSIRAQVISEGEITVPTQTFTDIVRKITDQEVTLKVPSNSSQFEVVGRNCQFSLATLPANHFPAMEDIKEEASLKVACSELTKIIEHTHFSISLEETRYNLNGIYLHTRKGELLAASTDGHRLSVASTAFNNASNVQDFGVILPRKTIEEIIRIFKDAKNIQADIEIILGVNKIKFIYNNIILLSRLIDGTFPSYEEFIPKKNNSKLIINAKLLAEVIDRVATVTIDRFRGIKLFCSVDHIEITASGESRGSATEKVPYSQESSSLCQFAGEETILIGFNPKYLLDILNTIKNNHIEFYFTDSSSPVLIKLPDNTNYTFVVMPVKI